MPLLVTMASLARPRARLMMQHTHMNIPMPRTVESIVENFRAAAELRRQGRPIWRLTITIKPILHESGTTPPEIIEKGKKVASAVRAAVAGFDPELDEIVEWFGDLGAAPTANDIDEPLEQLYDWADRNRVWIA